MGRLVSVRTRERAARLRGERGETLIEFAYASLIFFAMVFGALEFGIGVWNYNLVSNLAQEGARYAAVHGKNSGSAVGNTEVQNYVNARASGLLTGVVATTPLGAPNTKVPGTIVDVTVAYNISVGGGLLPFWNIPIQSSAQMVVAR